MKSVQKTSIRMIFAKKMYRESFFEKLQSFNVLILKSFNLFLILVKLLLLFVEYHFQKKKSIFILI
jgi:hypothetical protein